MERLLLVEDNRLFRDGLALLLERRTGLSSVQVGSLAETKETLEGANRKPACVVVNLELPEGEGIEVLKRLDGIPVLALSKSRNLKRQEEAMRLGANEVLDMTEPIEKILVAVERLMGRRSIHHALGPADEQVWDIVRRRAYSFKVYDPQYARVSIDYFL